ncbi:trypsin-like peptidase domain-containing protein [Candidatus Kaiserbacteria bacterium]|nr:trypsin-like peptidase domain-containing protein [Candidatus Kaiserbacteria bacterium]
MKISGYARDVAPVVAVIAVGWLWWNTVIPPETTTLIESSVKIHATFPDIPVAHPTPRKTGLEDVGGSIGAGTVVGSILYRFVDGKHAVHAAIVSVAHVVKDAQNVDVEWKGKHIPGRVIAKDDELDLALVEVPVSLPKAEMFFGQVKVGMPQWTVGYPYGTGVSITYGFVSTINPVMGLRQASASIWPGNSGGGVFIIHQNHFVLVGVADAVYVAQLSPQQMAVVDTVGFFVTTNKVKKFLLENHVSL